jgi:hypothetical protein
MEDIINEEYEIFLEDMDRGITFNRFLMVDDYEDNYSHNEIAEAMNTLASRIRQWLHENKPGKYIVSVSPDYCIFVMTVKEAQMRNVSTYTLLNVVK